MESIAVDGAKSAINIVLSKAWDEIHLMWGFRSDLNKLKKRLKMMEALLVRLGERQLQINNVELKWVDEVKKAAYEADDLLDEILYEQLRRKQEIWRSFMSMLNPFGFEWRIGGQMIEQLTERKPDLTSNVAHINKLRGLMGGAKYLLVLDDVWHEKEELWQSLKGCLHSIGGSIGSVVLITCRKRAVADSVKSSSVRPLEGLAPEDSRALFEQTVFANEGKCPSSLEVSAGKIIDKCKGVPLAIRTLGAALRSNEDPRHWESIANSELWNTQQFQEIAPYLLISFRHLPSLHVQQCFAYCSIYPKDSIIWKDGMICFEEENRRGGGEVTDYWTGEWLGRLPHLRDYGLGGNGIGRRKEEQPDRFVITPLLALRSLRSLVLSGWPKLKSLPDQLGRFTLLEQLEICYFDGMEEIPEWIGGLSSLFQLVISSCSNVKSFPSRGAMLKLKQLYGLWIWGCPLLTEGCRKDDGPEWHKISHIKYIDIDEEVIQNHL